MRALKVDLLKGRRNVRMTDWREGGRGKRDGGNG